MEASTRGLARALITQEDDEIFIKPSRECVCVFNRARRFCVFEFLVCVSEWVGFIRSLAVRSVLQCGAFSQDF